MINTTTIAALYFTTLLCFNACFGQQKQSTDTQTDALLNYVQQQDSNFTWDNYEKIKTPEGTYYEINFVSQTWHKTVWKHRMIAYVPYQGKSSNTMLMVLRHLHNRSQGFASLKLISDSTNTAAAILYDVPNQPLFNGKEEDDLQAYTFSQYIKTGDESWPLLFPMVKSVVRAMDVVQNIVHKEKDTAISRFIIAGHSKRGHATWLAAAADARIAGIIPIAIDILNSAAQLPHQLQAFGEYSTPSKAATDFLAELALPRGKRLIQMVDAYSYKERLTVPKLIVSATNDDFFTTDALNLYWDGLKGPKWILYLSNASHVRADSDPRINPTAFAFVRAVAAQSNLPEFMWNYKQIKNTIELTIQCDTAAANARLWTCHSKSRDLRQASWAAHSVKFLSNGTKNSKGNKTIKEFRTTIEIPPNGYMGMFGEVEFIKDGHTFLLSTQTNISSLEK